MVTIDKARAAKPALRAALESVEGVCGVGLAQRGDESDWVLRVNVYTLSARKDVPPVIDGVPVQVAVVGAVTAL
ncbi:hypothetical protein LEP48_01255 [Isoptericola sp. NEAU-Y5]|uniref:Uncharacterized protein n=1 Tax=Isoptericola luteus TaxID=2879484 RepID=A0ABS7ZA91_9MICO|nr:hypothetical protein [Isoptericola sp. NEAU-Y5]MCA5891977.1 hypothetical protein [Isoptericola sp. NEAU-Y5]